MKTEQEIRNRLVSIRSWKAEAKEKMDKINFKKWEVVENYLKWVLYN
ncbi:hypothetical protein LCGC14_1587630 [marine sediment metagenome]|uniref:Uncharacterized protein n=1 Tax=marine sediment metagenome TaxID=412755 RepID=A0A0F9J140_9ZZZZ